MTAIVSTYLDLLDLQRETTYASLERLSEIQLWHRPAPKEWSIGEILDHNTLLFATTVPYIKFAWKTQHRRAEKCRENPYTVEIDDPYRKSSFPMWVGFLWKPRYSPKHPVLLERLRAENRHLHAEVRAFYAEKEPDLLGNTFVFDPLFGSVNLIVTLRIGIYHDQLHFDDVAKMVAGMPGFQNEASSFVKG